MLKYSHVIFAGDQHRKSCYCSNSHYYRDIADHFLFQEKIIHMVIYKANLNNNVILWVYLHTLILRIVFDRTDPLRWVSYF